jgi:hypothetical protein
LSNRGLISSIYKELQKLNTRNKLSNQYMGIGTEQTLSNEEIQMANKHMKNVYHL